MDITDKLDMYLNEGWKEKLFKMWYGTSTKDIIKRAKALTDKEVLSLFDGYKDKSDAELNDLMGPRKVQVRALATEYRKRKLG